MGAALNAVGDVGTALKQGPSLVVAAGIAGLILLIGALITVIPVIGQIVYSIIVVPLVLVGLVAMANAAIDDRAGLGEFTDGIGDHGSDAVGAYAILFVVQFVAVVVLGIGAVVAGVGVLSSVSAAGSGDPGSGLDAVTGGGLLLFAALLVVGVLVALILGLVQNFLDVAVVIGGQSGMDAVRESAGLIRDAPLSTVGYLLVRAAVTLVAGILPLALFGLGVALPVGGGDGGAMASAGIVILLLGALALPLPVAASFAYHAGYYRRRRDVRGRQVADASDGNERRASRDADPMGD